MILKLFFSFFIWASAIFIAYAEPLDNIVALVNDSVITQSELDQHVKILTQQMLSKGMQIPALPELKKQILRHLIDVDLQLQLAKQNDINIDTADLHDAIVKIAKLNNLSVAQLREEVGKQGLEWKIFRENIRKEMIISRLQQKAVSSDINISLEQVNDYLSTALQEEKTKQTYHLQNIVILLPEEPTSQQLAKARAKASALLAKLKNGEDFTRLAIAESSGEFALEGGDLGERHLAELPELFTKAVVNMKPGDISGPLRAGNGLQLIKLVKIGNSKIHHEVRKTHVRHILFKPDANMTAAEAKKQAENIYQQLQSNKDFALMAKQYSLDAVSSTKGGDLGWVSSGDLLPEFEKVMDALPLHKVSKPVKTNFGWHLIEVVGRKVVDDSDAFQRQQVRQFLFQRKFTEAVQNWQRQLRSKAYINILDKQLA